MCNSLHVLALIQPMEEADIDIENIQIYNVLISWKNSVSISNKFSMRICMYQTESMCLDQTVITCALIVGSFFCFFLFHNRFCVTSLDRFACASVYFLRRLFSLGCFAYTTKSTKSMTCTGMSPWPILNQIQIKLAGMEDLETKWVRLTPDGTKSMTLSDQISVHFAN